LTVKTEANARYYHGVSSGGRQMPEWFCVEHGGHSSGRRCCSWRDADHQSPGYN